MNQVINYKWYVYVLIDPFTEKIFYVGKGQKYRMYNHYYNVKNKKIPNGNYRLYEKIKSIIVENKTIIYDKVFQTNDEDEAYHFEYDLIKKIGLENLCNLFDGFGGSYSGKNHWNYGKKCSDETKKKISASKMGDKHSEESKKIMSLKRKGVLHPLYGKNHSEESKKIMSLNHKDFNGSNNPFYGKTHNESIKNKFKDLYSKKWIVTLPNNNVYEFKGKKEVKSFIEKYNIENKTKISFFSLFQYGKNGDGWVLKK
jgi:hypothetical protein